MMQGGKYKLIFKHGGAIKGIRVKAETPGSFDEDWDATMFDDSVNNLLYVHIGIKFMHSFKVLLKSRMLLVILRIELCWSLRGPQEEAERGRRHRLQLRLHRGKARVRHLCRHGRLHKGVLHVLAHLRTQQSRRQKM